MPYRNIVGRLLAILLLLLAMSNAATAAQSPTIDFTPNLPIIFLEATNGITGDVKVHCAVRLQLPATNAAEPTTTQLAAQVRYHGATSQGYPKKSLALTLARAARLLDLRESTHWVLNAAFIDRSLMRHKLSYDLFRSLSESNAPRHAVGSRFVEVFLNNRYRGVYLLMERVDRQLLGLTPWESNQLPHACIYKAEDHAANFSQPGHGGYEQREPDPATRGEYWQPMDEFNRFVSRSPQQEFFHPTTGVGSRLDLANAIDFHLLVLLTCNIDGITKNFLIARDVPSERTPAPRFAFVPWDYDGTFGRDWNASKVETDRWLSNHLFDRLHSHPLLRQQFHTRWQQLRAGPFATSVIHAAIDANVRTLGDAVQRNARRWASAAGAYPDQANFEEDITLMKRWVRARGEWLDTELKRRAERVSP